MKMFLLVLLAISSTTATPLLGETAPPPNPLCSVIMTYDEIHSDSPHWSASFQIKTREPLEPGSILDVQLAGNNTSTSPIPTIVGIKINGHNVCPTEKVLTTISTYSSKPALDRSNNNATVLTTTERAEETEQTIQTDATTAETLQTNPTTPQSPQLDT